MNSRLTTTNFVRTSARRGAVLAIGLALALGFVAPSSSAQIGDRVTIPSGTRFTVRMDSGIESGTTRQGDAVRATVTTPVLVSNRMVIPSGTTLSGTVLEVTASKAWGTSSGVTIELNRLTSTTGASVNVDGELTTPNGEPMTVVDNLRRGTELSFVLNRNLLLTSDFYGQDETFSSNVRVLSATASTRAGQMFVRIVAQNQNTLRLTETHQRRGDVMHIFVNGTRTGYVRGMNELVVTFAPGEWRGVSEVVVHSLGNDISIRSNAIGAGSITAVEAAAIERQVSSLLSDYARILGVRYNMFTGQLTFTARNYRENEVELLFALNSLASATKLYTQLIKSTDDVQGMAGATDIVLEQARAVDRAANRTRSGRADSIVQRWSAMRDNVMIIDNGTTNVVDRSSNIPR